MSWRKSVVTLVPRCECGYEFDLLHVRVRSGKTEARTLTNFKCPRCEEKVRPILTPIISQGRGVIAIVRNRKIKREGTPSYLENAKFITLVPKCSCGFTFETTNTEKDEIAFIPYQCPECGREVKKIIVPQTERLIKSIEIRK